MPQHTSNSVVRRRAVQISGVDNSRTHAQHLSVNRNRSDSGESRSVLSDRRSQAATWDVSSQASTAPAKTSSMGSPGLERSISASYSTPAIEPNLVESGKLKKLGPLHEHLETVRQYKPSQAATDAWIDSASEYNVDVTQAGDNPEAGLDNNSWTFWEKMVNIADALATAKYLEDAFDLHYICFMEIFNDTARRLRHWESSSTRIGQSDQDRKVSKVIVGTPPVLQLLIRTAIGAARSCTTSAHSKLARVMLDATHSVLRQSKHATRVRALLILFDIYRNTLMEPWSDQNTPTPRDCCNALPVSPKSSRLNQEYSLDDLLWYTHPAIINREYLTVSTHLLSLPSYQISSPSLPARSTVWQQPLAQFVRDLAMPSKTSKAWVELTKQRLPLEPPHFLDAYMREANAFIRWCINAIFEGKTALDEGFMLESHGAHVVSRDDLNNARLTLFWFLVGQRKPMEVHSPASAHSGLTGLPKFPHSDDNPATSDAFFVLSSFIFGFCTPGALPDSLHSVSDYAMAALRQIAKWPYGFVWHYLQHAVSFVSRLHTDGDFRQQKIHRKDLKSAILGSEARTTADAAVLVPAELHPQPLPEFINVPILQPNKPSSTQSKPSSPRSAMKVTFAESPDESSSPAKSSKRRWLKRLSGSISRIDAATLQTLGDKSTSPKSKPTTSSKISANATATQPSSPNPTKKTSSAISKDVRPPRQSTSSTDPTSPLCRYDSPDDFPVNFPGSYTAIAPLMSSPNGAGIDTITAVSGAFPYDRLTMLNALPFEAIKIASVVHSTEILLPDSRPPFVVLH